MTFGQHRGTRIGGRARGRCVAGDARSITHRRASLATPPQPASRLPCQPYRRRVAGARRLVPRPGFGSLTVIGDTDARAARLLPRLVGVRRRSRPLTPRESAPVPRETARYCASASIIAAAFSAIIKVGELVFPEVIAGITDASAMRSPVTARQRSRASTTASASPSGPIRQVPTGWKMVVPT